MEQEVFKTIENSHYQISNYGRVKVLGYEKISTTYKGAKKKYFVEEHFKKPQNNNSKKYWRVEIRYFDNTKKMCSIHRLVAECFVSNPDDKPYINHIDGNKDNNYYTNLEWCTNQENMNHRYEALKSFIDNSGSNNVTSKLNEQQVIEIAQMIKDGVFYSKIAKQFKISKSTIGMIKSGKVWRQLGLFTPTPNSNEKYFSLRYDPNPLEI
jgi:uncharacterized protein YerC